MHVVRFILNYMPNKELIVRNLFVFVINLVVFFKFVAVTII